MILEPPLPPHSWLPPMGCVFALYVCGNSGRSSGHLYPSMVSMRALYSKFDAPAHASIARREQSQPFGR